MELAHTLALSNLRASLALNQKEAERLRSLVATSPIPDIKMWAGMDLVRIGKLIETQEEEIRQFKAE